MKLQERQKSIKELIQHEGEDIHRREDRNDISGIGRSNAATTTCWCTTAELNVKNTQLS